MIWNAKTFIIASLLAFTVKASAHSQCVGSTVTIEFENVEAFADFETVAATLAEDAFSQSISEQLKAHLSRKQCDALHLSLVFKDIDLAGRVDTLNGIAVRGFKAVSPAKLHFTYQLKNGEGVVIAEGTQRLVDNSFMSFKKPTVTEGSYSYERELLNTWLDRLSIQSFDSDTMTASSPQGATEPNA